MRRAYCDGRDQDLLFLCHGLLSAFRWLVTRFHVRRCDGCAARTETFDETSRALRVAFGRTVPTPMPRRVPRLATTLLVALLLAAIGYSAYSLFAPPPEPEGCGSHVESPIVPKTKSVKQGPEHC